MTALRSMRLALYTASVLLALAATPAAFAVGTPAGTVITNTATVDYEDVNGNPLTASAMVTTTVSAVASVSIVPTSLSANADPGDQVCYAHTVTNGGNSTDTIEVPTTSSQTWTVEVYNDADSSGDLTAGDTLLTDTTGSGDPDTGPLDDSVTNPGGESMDVLVCVTVPTGATDGTVDTTTVDIESDNDPTQTDQATDTTNVVAPTLTVNKTVSPAGNQPPGTTLTYTITITNSGTGQANNVALTDPIPTNTTYVGATIVQDGTPKTDAGADDNADFDVTTSGAITVDVGTMATTASTTISFQVMID